jgi:thiosulfate/3-mercaptopyruvate sulfurtransferase
MQYDQRLGSSVGKWLRTDLYGHKMNVSLVWLGVVVVLFSSCTWNIPAADNNTIPPAGDAVAWSVGQHFLSVAEAEALLTTHDEVMVFEISQTEEYQQAHLPGVYNLWRPAYENNTDFPYEGMSASREQMAQLLSAQGVSAQTPILLYDTKGSADALRLLWILIRYGHPNVAVIDGGKTAWQQAGFPLTALVPAPKLSTHYTFPHSPDDRRVATRADVLAALTDTNTIILDTREPEEYAGAPYISNGKLHAFKAGAYARGCIPTAIYLNWSEAVDLHGDHRIKSKAALSYNFQKIGLSPGKKIITYCQSGVRSAHTTYVLTDLLGYPDVRNYDGSWIEWSYFYLNGQQVPIEQHTSQEAFDQAYAALAKKMEVPEIIQ